MQQAQQTKVNTKDLVETALLIALVYIATRFINIRLPIAASGGLVHLGNTMLFIAAIVFGPKKGAAAGAFGMGLFDLLSEWAMWAPFTFVVRGIMGYIIGKIAWSNGREGNNMLVNIAGILSIRSMDDSRLLCNRRYFIWKLGISSYVNTREHNSDSSWISNRCSSC